MKPTGGGPRIVAAALGCAVAVLLVVVGLPHHHDGAAASHPASACRFCKLQDGFSADPPSTARLDEPVVATPATRCPSVGSPRAVRFVRSTAPRAPPISS